VRIPARSDLLLEAWQGCSVLCTQEVATAGQQATHIDRIAGDFVSAHRAIALFDPPADGTFTRIVGAIKGFSLGSFPTAIARQPMPEVPAIQKQEAQSIRQTEVCTFLVALPLDSAGAALAVQQPAPVVGS